MRVVKNITYCTFLYYIILFDARQAHCGIGLAKTSPYILTPELFALHLGAFLLGKYAHLTKAFVTVEQLRWARISVGTGAGADASQGPHKHSFWRDGEDKCTTKVVVDASKGKDGMTASVVSGINDLLGARTCLLQFDSQLTDLPGSFEVLRFLI